MFVVGVSTQKTMLAQRGVGRRIDGGRIVGLEPDAVADVVPLV
jgi:hypothetical protein